MTIPIPQQQAQAQAQQPPANVDYSSLLNTLGPAFAMMLSQSMSQQDQDQLHQQAGEAQRQAQAAQSQYQQAIAQPPPQAQPNTLDQVAGGAASILSRNPLYQQAAYQRADQQHQELANARLQNLQALKNIYDQKQDTAEKLGNTELAGEMRMKSEQIMKNMQVILQGMKDIAHQTGIETQQTGATQRTGMQQTGANQRNAATNTTSRQNNLDTNATRLATAGMTSTTTGGGGNPSADFEAFLGKPTLTDFGPIYDLGQVGKSGKDLQRARQLANAAGVTLLQPKEYSAAQDMETSWRTLQSQVDQVTPYLVNSTDPIERAKQAAANAWGIKTGANPILAAYDTGWANTIRTLRAQAGAGNFRMTNAEIDRAMRLDRPNVIWDTKPILDQKNKNWAIIRQNMMSPLVSKDWRSVKDPARVTVMDPQGQTSVVPLAQAEKLITKEHYARVLTEADIDPAVKAAANARLKSSMAPDTAAAPATPAASTGEVWERGPDGRPRLVSR